MRANLRVFVLVKLFKFAQAKPRTREASEIFILSVDKFSNPAFRCNRFTAVRIPVSTTVYTNEQWIEVYSLCPQLRKLYV